MFNLKFVLILMAVSIGFSVTLLPATYGHGLGFEILPPVQLGDKRVSLEVTSSQYSDPKSTDRQITFSLFDITTGITLRDVTYHIKASKANTFLFEDTFKIDDGIFTMNFLPAESGPITFEEEVEGSFLDALVGTQKEMITIKGPAFNSGGLYNFQVEILTAESYSNVLENPIIFDVGLSIPDRTYYNVVDPNFGHQEISIITYYDKIENFQYDPQTQSITFQMPFDWSFDNINQTSVVHEELVIPKAFGDLMVTNFLVLVNDLKVSEYALTIDDFSEKNRIIHLVLNQNEMFSLDQKNRVDDEMQFLLKPSEGDLPLGTVTGNGQFRITLDWEPKEIKSGSKTTFYFDITDVFLKNRPVSVSYDLSIIHDGKEIFSQSGISTDTKGEHNVAEFIIPEHISGPITLQFDNLNDNGLARVGIPVVVNRINAQSQSSEVISIPDWVRNNAGWWSDGQIGDLDFAKGIEYLIKEEIIIVPTTNIGQASEDAVIPDWVRNNAGWWKEGLISDEEFANGLQYLIKNGIISV